MSLAETLIVVPCLSDNYAYLLRDTHSGEVAVIDVPEAAPILAELDRRGWSATQVWLTHHHWDHVDGLPDLLAQHAASVVGAKADADRLPPLDLAVTEGDTVKLGALSADVYDVSGHTMNHIALHVPAARLLFTADSLMALGCGRVFEGEMAQMWNSLQKFKDLAPHTLICSGHEYTETNARFALTIEPENTDLQARVDKIREARTEGRPTVPSHLGEELATNPFMRAHLESVKSSLDMSSASDAEVFAEIRRRKDAF